MSEVRIVDALTGGEKGSKPERYDLVPPEAMDEVARVYGYGATKYANRNWERGYDWGLSLAALHRHIKAFERRESIDSESGLHHLAHAVFHCLALMTYEKCNLGTDTRSNALGSLRNGFEAVPQSTTGPVANDAPGATSPELEAYLELERRLRDYESRTVVLSTGSDLLAASKAVSVLAEPFVDEDHEWRPPTGA